jgi:RND family efflux transporter MFP subunit
VVVQRRLDPGALVGPTAGTGSILTVARIDILRVFIPVNERDVRMLKVGQDAHVELDAAPGTSFHGQVVRITPALDPLTRTVDAEIQIANPSMSIKPGMYGRGSIVVGVHRGSIVVPASAVQISNERRYLFVLKGDRVKRVEIEIGVDAGDWLEVATGLDPDAEIVTAGSDILSDNAVVKAARNVDPYTGAASRETTIPGSSN